MQFPTVQRHFTEPSFSQLNLIYLCKLAVCSIDRQENKQSYAFCEKKWFQRNTDNFDRSPF
jgi:hypothetical protein